MLTSYSDYNITVFLAYELVCFDVHI